MNNEIKFYNDYELCTTFASSIGCRIMQIYHSNYPNITINVEDNILSLYKIVVTKLKKENFDFGFRFLRECLMSACEGYKFVIPECSEEENEDYEKFISSFLSKRILEEN